jgi:hypothetical protein
MYPLLKQTTDLLNIYKKTIIMKGKFIPILVIVLILSAAGWKLYDYYNPSPPKVANAQTNDAPAAPTTGQPQTASYVPPAPGSTSISLPEKPVNGTKMGVIEVGASGFNSFVIDVDQQDHWEIVSKDFGESLAYEGFATADDLKKGIKSYLSNMFNRGVSGRHAHFVVSSGAQKNPKVKSEVIPAIKAAGWTVNEVTADQEGKYALRATLPPQYRDNAYVVDMGSGNTKISWYEGTSLKTLEGPGAKYYQNKTSDQDVYTEIKQKVAQVPSVKRQVCFIIGGVPYMLAKESRQGDERYTTLGAPDAYNSGDDVKKKSGINIYHALVDGSSTSTFVFDWDANFTIGFLLGLN